MRLTSPLNLPAPGRRQWLYGDSSSSQPPVFLLNSRLDRFSATGLCSPSRRWITYYRHPFSRSYGVILPSSFSMDHSSTLGFSPRLPVSVCGTVGLCIPVRGFSRRPAPQSSRSTEVYPLGVRSHLQPTLPSRPGYSVASGQPKPDDRFASASSQRSIHTARHGNLDPFPIVYGSRPRLRGRLTRSG